jgi:hypothetical protein
MRRYYRMCFQTTAGQIVLDDLRRFCGDQDDLFDPKNERREAYDLGKRRVLLRIQTWMSMTMQEIEALSQPDDDEETAS